MLFNFVLIDQQNWSLTHNVKVNLSLIDNCALINCSIFHVCYFDPLALKVWVEQYAWIPSISATPIEIWCFMVEFSCNVIFHHILNKIIHWNIWMAALPLSLVRLPVISFVGVIVQKIIVMVTSYLKYHSCLCTLAGWSKAYNSSS